MALTVADLTYDPVAHRTTAPDGSDVPHVTHVLSAVGVATDYDEVAELGPRARANLEAGAVRGTVVHADCHAYDDADLDLADVDARIRPWVLAWAEARTALGLVPVTHGRERRLYHPLYRYTGTQDGIFTATVRGVLLRVLIDIKTGDPEAAAAQYQTAAYQAAWDLAHPEEPVDERWAVQLCPDRRVPYRVANYTARPEGAQDRGVWLACLATYNAQPGRRLRAA